jgi:hypothetical protein
LGLAGQPTNATAEIRHRRLASFRRFKPDAVTICLKSVPWANRFGRVPGISPRHL